MHGCIPHDAALADVGAARLELRFDQRDQVPPGSQQRHRRRQDFGQRNKGDIQRHHIHRDPNLGWRQIPGIDSVMHGHTRILPEFPRELPLAHIHGVNVARVLCRDGRMLAGAGAVEIELAHRLAQFAESTTGLEQYAIAKFGEALEAFPRTLAENSGQNERDVITALYAAHAAGKASVGVDIEGGVTCDAAALHILDSFVVKNSALRLAAEAAITVLRVDQIIMSKQAGGPKPRQPGAPDED